MIPLLFIVTVKLIIIDLTKVIRCLVYVSISIKRPSYAKIKRLRRSSKLILSWFEAVPRGPGESEDKG